MKKGFTLIELVIVVSVLAIILVTVTTVLLTSFRARSRVDISDKLEQNGNFALAEIRNNILNSDGQNVVFCGGNTISFVNKQDGATITLSCADGDKIASASAVTQRLTSADVVALNCATFVSCSSLVSGIVSTVDFKFVLATNTMPSVGIAETISRAFETKVVIRN